MLRYILIIGKADNEQSFFEKLIGRFNPRFRVIWAGSGKDGVRIFRKTDISLVLINYQLKDMTGLDCLAFIRSIPNKDQVPVYVYNDIITPQLIERAEHSKASGCFSFAYDGKDAGEFLKKVLINK